VLVFAHQAVIVLQLDLLPITGSSGLRLAACHWRTSILNFDRSIASLFTVSLPFSGV